uniref:hypothetical protein n=1 Tax=Staphylococcus aureus TaxID=1280 RepID=UPI0021B21AF8
LNGKFTAKIKIPKDTSKQQIQQIPLSNHNLKPTIQRKHIIKLIPVPQKLLNILPK